MIKPLQPLVCDVHTWVLLWPAQVVPMMIKLSRTHVDFRFADSLEFTVAEELTIANPGNSRAEFKCVPSVPPLALVLTLASHALCR
jgi:hypothetical protein